MYIVKINNIKKLFAAFLVLALSVVVAASPMFDKPVQAATQTDFLSSIDKGMNQCGPNSLKTRYASPYDVTNYMCVGPEVSSYITYYWQLEVKLPGPIKNSTVTAQNGDGQTISFDQTDSSGSMYVSIPSQTGQAGMGYEISYDPSTKSCPSSSQAAKANTITVTSTGNGVTDTQHIDLCSLLTKSTPNGIAQITVGSGMVSDANLAAGKTSQTPGVIKAHIGIYRDGIPAGALMSGDSRFYTPLLQQGIKSIKLTGTKDNVPIYSKSSAADGNSWYSLNSDGNLTIGSLPLGTYSLEIHYDDHKAAISIGDTQNLIQGYLSQDVKISLGPKAILTGDNWLTASDGTIQYYGSDGKPVDPTQLAPAATAPTCGSLVAGAGWIVCPVINGLSTLNDGMWSLVSSLLTVNPIKSSDSLYSAWGIIRNLANVAFVVIFLIIIFSQLSSVGITNYGVKKMLPRLVVSAILVNVSFLLIQIVVDVANILGSSVYSLIVSQAPNTVVTWTGLITTLLTAAGGAAAGVAAIAIAGGAAAAFWIILPMAAMAALGLLAAVLTLIVRQALIPLLAMLAPLAFVALLMPNTESWFKKWKSMFINLLMLYPLAALVFGGSQFAAAVMINKNDWWSYLIGLLILSLPLFSLPFLAKQGGPLLSKVGGSLNGLANKAGKPISSLTSPKRELAEKKYMSTNPSDISKYNVGKRMRFGALRGKQADKAKGSAYDRMISENTDEDILAGKLDSKLGPETALREKDAAALRQKKRESELIESGAQNIRRTYGSTGTIGAPGVQGGAEKAFAEAFASGDRVKMLSAMSVLASAGPPGIDKLHSSVLGINPSQNPELFKSFQNELNSVPGLKSKDAALAKLAYTESGQLSDIVQERSTYSGLSAADAASQTEASLRRIQATNGMLPSVAQAILQNETLSGQLTPVTQKIIEDIASGNTASSTGADSGSAKQAAEATLKQAAAGTSGTNPFIVDGGGVIDQNSARSRAEATAAQAAQGTAGDTPFIVDHSGTASQPRQAGDAGSHTDEQGRQTPDGTAEGYHDYFNH